MNILCNNVFKASQCPTIQLFQSVYYIFHGQFPKCCSTKLSFYIFYIFWALLISARVFWWYAYSGGGSLEDRPGVLKKRPWSLPLLLITNILGQWVPWVSWNLKNSKLQGEWGRLRTRTPEQIWKPASWKEFFFFFPHTLSLLERWA